MTMKVQALLFLWSVVPDKSQINREETWTLKTDKVIDTNYECCGCPFSNLGKNKIKCRAPLNRETRKILILISTTKIGSAYLYDYVVFAKSI